MKRKRGNDKQQNKKKQGNLANALYSKQATNKLLLIPTGSYL